LPISASAAPSATIAETVSAGQRLGEASALPATPAEGGAALVPGLLATGATATTDPVARLGTGDPQPAIAAASKTETRPTAAIERAARAERTAR
jgi:hypothetical protein